MSPRLLARFLRSRCVAGSRDDRRVVNAVGRGEMMIGLALCVVPLAFYAWLVDRRPGAWSNGIVLAVGLGMAGLTAAGIIVRTVPVIGSLIVGTLVVVAALGTAVLPFLLIVNGVEMWRKEGRSLSNVLSGALGVGLLVLMAWCLRSVFSPFGVDGFHIVGGYLIGVSINKGLAYRGAHHGRRDDVDAYFLDGFNLVGGAEGRMRPA